MALRYKHWISLLAIMAAGLLLRIVQIDREALWTDEALTLLIIHWPVADLLLKPVDPTPGLYYILAKLFVAEGSGVAEVRSLSILFGTLSISAMYVIGRLTFSPKWALALAAMLAVSPVMVDYSQEARAYSLLVLVVLCSAAALLWWVRELRGGSVTFVGLALFAATTVLAFYTHFTSIFWIVPVVIGGREITDRFGNSTARRAYIAACILMLILAFPEMLRFYKRLQFGGTLGFLTNEDVPQFLRRTGDVLLPSGSWSGFDVPLSAVVLLCLLIYSGFRLWSGRAELRTWASANPAAPLVVATLLLTPVLVWIFGYLVSPIFMERTILLGAPGLALLIAYVSQLERWPFTAVLFVGASLAALALNGTVRSREGWEPVARTLRTSMGPGDGIVVCPAWSAPALLHALGNTAKNPVFLIDRPDVLMMSPTLNDPAWEERYHATVTERAVRKKLNEQRLGTREAVVSTPARLWLVEGDCSRAQKEFMRSWIGPRSKIHPVPIRNYQQHKMIRVSVVDDLALSRRVSVHAN